MSESKDAEIETFDSYMPIPNKLDEFREVLRKDKERLGEENFGINHGLANACKSNIYGLSRDEKIAKYDKMRSIVSIFYHIDEDLKKELEKLAHAMYELDCYCGIDEHLTPENEREVLPKIDADKIKFRGIFKKWIKEINDDVQQWFLVSYAELLYLFNGYQAPLRASASLAVKDSMGQTNHFAEMLVDITNEIKYIDPK
jgi:hypothetical protein